MYGLICNPPSPPRQAIIISRANMCTVLKGWGGVGGMLVGPGGDAHTPRGVTGKGDKVVTAASVATVFAPNVLSQQQ